MYVLHSEQLGVCHGALAVGDSPFYTGGMPTSTLTPSEQETLLKQRALWERGPAHIAGVTPWTRYHLSGSKGDWERGQKLLSEGKMGCIVLAGGQGVRLGAGRLKGALPVSVAHGKSLFQLLAERVLAASKWAGCTLPVAVMTSPANHDETVRFFAEHGNFGLKAPEFFQQRELPLLDEEGEALVEDGHVVRGPNGNGEVFHRFVEAGIEWDVEYVNVVPIDNPLADPFDAELLGFTERMGVELAIKAIFQKEASSQVGILGEKEGHIRVVEYTEFEGEVPEGALANLSLCCVSMDFVKEAAGKELPLHMVKRQGWKFETFIFDLWEEGEVLVYPKRECFAPLKSEADFPLVQAALQARDRRCLEKRGDPIPEEPFEVDADLLSAAPF